MTMKNRIRYYEDGKYKPSEISFNQTPQHRHRSAQRMRQLSTHCIEGEYVTLQQIAERLGLEKGRARHKLIREQKKEGPVTWAGLAQ